MTDEVKPKLRPYQQAFVDRIKSGEPFTLDMPSSRGKALVPNNPHLGAAIADIVMSPLRQFGHD